MRGKKKERKEEGGYEGDMGQQWQQSSNLDSSVLPCQLMGSHRGGDTRVKEEV